MFAILMILQTMTHPVFAQNDPLPFTYTVRIPQTSMTCDAEAQALGQRFKQATSSLNVQVTGAACVGTDTLQDNGQAYSLYLLSVTYLADSQVPINQTIYGYSGTNFQGGTGTGFGIYNHFSDCKADLNDKIHEYVHHAALSPLSAYCEPSSLGDGMGGYSAVIESYGIAQQQLFAFEIDTISALDPLSATNLKVWLRSLGADVVHSTDQLLFKSGQLYLYYAPQQLEINIARVADNATPDECQAQIQDATEAYSHVDSGQAKAFSFCSSNVLQTVWTLGDYTVLTEFENSNSPANYLTFDSCRSDRGRVLSTFRSSHEVDAYMIDGAVCVYDSTQTYPYQMVILESGV